MCWLRLVGGMVPVGMRGANTSFEIGAGAPGRGGGLSLPTVPALTLSRSYSACLLTGKCLFFGQYAAETAQKLNNHAWSIARHL